MVEDDDAGRAGELLDGFDGLGVVLIDDGGLVGEVVCGELRRVVVVLETGGVERDAALLAAHVLDDRRLLFVCKVLLVIFARDGVGLEENLDGRAGAVFRVHAVKQGGCRGVRS